MTKKVKRPTRPENAPLRVVLYVRVSTAEQADSGLGLAAQEACLRAAAAHKGWEVVGLLSDAGASGKSLANRRALAEALDLVANGSADVLAVSKLDRLSRSVLDFAGLMAQAQRQGWGLLALDVDVDTTTPGGRLVANIMAGVAEWERDVIASRTRDALAAKRAAGLRLGGPRSIDDEVVERIVRERASGRGLRVIAEGLTADGVPTSKGGAWSTSTVQRVLARPDQRARPEQNLRLVDEATQRRVSE
jgi:DNA invertase Pin-like site-specific DNA recombinase